ncbi:MAG: PAS domain S-box protein, partial [Gallionella sp.]
MNKELRVLMLEDTPTDAELAGHELRKAGIAFTSLRVETREAFIHALEEFRPDIILSDYKLPDFNGIAALEIVKRDHPEVPVVMVTGALPDIEAVEMIHAGAKDYVLKDRLARLAPAVQRALSTVQSNRARQAAEQALQESKARYKRIAEGLTDYQYTVRIDNGYAVKTTQSPACVTVTGYTAEEFSANPGLWIQMVASEDREFVLEHVKQILAGNDVPPMEHRIIRKNGDIRWVSDTTILFKDASGKLLSYDGVIKDITERKRAELMLRASESQLAVIYANVSDIIFVISVEPNDQFRFAMVNGSFFKTTHLSEEQVIGRLVKEVIPEPGLALALEKYKEAIKEGRAVHWEETSVYPAGRKVGDVSVVPVFDANGNCTQLIGTVHDLTERKQAEEELRKYKDHLEEEVQLRTAELVLARDAADAANKAKSVFLSSISHELR